MSRLQSSPQKLQSNQTPSNPPAGCVNPAKEFEMITITETNINRLMAGLASSNGARIVNDDKWLCIFENEESGLESVRVYQRKAYAKKTTILYEGYNMDKALVELFYDD